MNAPAQKPDPRQKHRQSRCHRCKAVVDSRLHPLHHGPRGCGWILCRCGGCGCNYRRSRPAG